VAQVIFTARCSYCHPTSRVKALKEIPTTDLVQLPDLILPSSTAGLLTEGALLPYAGCPTMVPHSLTVCTDNEFTLHLVVFFFGVATFVKTEILCCEVINNEGEWYIFCAVQFKCNLSDYSV